MDFGAVSSAVKTKMTKQTSSWRKDTPLAKPQYNGPTPKVYQQKIQKEKSVLLEASNFNAASFI